MPNPGSRQEWSSSPATALRDAGCRRPDGNLLGCSSGTPGSPRFPLKGSLKGDADTGIDIDVDIIDTEDLVSLLGKGPYGAYYGFLWWLKGDKNWTY